MRRPPFNLIGSLLIVVQLVALCAVGVGAVQRFVPGWYGARYLLLACGLVALEATYVQHVIRRERMWLGEGARYLVVEIAALLLLMRVISLLEFSRAEVWAWAQELLRYPLTFFDYRYLGYLIVGLLVGSIGHTLARDLDELAPREFEQPVVGSDPNQRLLAQVRSDRLEALGRLSGRFVGGGVALVFGLTAQSVNIERIGAPGLPLPASAALAATCYFSSGFLLYSQARLALLQSRWRLEGVKVEEGIGRRWTQSSLLLIVGVVVAASALPRAYGLGLFDAVGVLAQGLAYLVVLLGYLLVTLVSLLAIIPVLLISLLTGVTTAPVVAPPPPPPPPPVELIERAPPLLPALIFWACAIFLAGYALWLFAQRHPGLLRVLAANRLLRGTWALLRGIWGGAAVWGGLVVQKVREQLRAQLLPAPQARERSLRGLAPREALRSIYRALLARARQHGLPRTQGQTPYEYSEVLARRLPEAAPEINALTEAFVAAEYSPGEPDEADVRAARGLWARLRRLLRRSSSQT